MRIPKHKKLKIGGLILIVITTAGLSIAKENMKTEKDNLLKSFPNLRVDSVSESPVKGLFEVVAGNQVFYFSPEGYLMFGELWSKDGKNLTAEVREKVLAEKVKNIPLDKALRIGSGPRQVIEFTDPDCPFCRRVGRYLSKRNDITRYVFFLPLRKIHPDSEKKARYILSHKEKENAFREVFSGSLDGKPVQRDKTRFRNWRKWSKVSQSIELQGSPSIWVSTAHP